VDEGKSESVDEELLCWEEHPLTTGVLRRGEWVEEGRWGVRPECVEGGRLGVRPEWADEGRWATGVSPVPPTNIESMLSPRRTAEGVSIEIPMSVRGAWMLRLLGRVGLEEVEGDLGMRLLKRQDEEPSSSLSSLMMVEERFF